MKRIDFNPCDDFEILDGVASNHKLHKTSFPYLRDRLDDIHASYLSYIESGGDPFYVLPLGIRDPLKAGLIKNYKSKPGCLKYIDAIKGVSPDVCPMCGSLSSPTIDHVLPKKTYPEFSFLSKNLVPACSCNIGKAENYRGAAPGQRVLNPHYDDVLSERLLSCLIEPDNRFLANIKIKIIYEDGNFLPAIQFHVDKVVRVSGIERWLDSAWAKLMQRPLNVIKTLPHGWVGKDDYFEYLTDLLDRYDAEFETPNNWQSIFIHGLIDCPDAWQLSWRRHNEFFL